MSPVYCTVPTTSRFCNSAIPSFRVLRAATVTGLRQELLIKLLMGTENSRDILCGTTARRAIDMRDGKITGDHGQRDDA